MRILQFGRFDFCEVKGGVQFYAESLTSEMQKKSNQQESVVIDQLVSAKSAKTRVEKRTPGWKISVASFGIFQSVPLSPTMLFWALRLCLTRKYDLIHLNFPDPLALVVAFFLPKKIPVVVTWHSDVIRQKWALRIYTPILQYFMRRVAKIIVATPYHLPSCSQLSDLKMDEKVVVIPFGIESRDWILTSDIQKKAEQIRQKFQGQFLLFAFGRHVPYKGFGYLLEALEKTERTHLILGGEGPLTETYRNLISRKNIQDRVSLIGLVSQAELVPYLYACDLFCFPSIDRTEAFGYAQLEAMMCGRPILSTFLNNGVNFVSLDRQTGLVVSPRDSDQLARAINELEKNPDLLKAYGQAARQRAMTEFTIGVMTQRTLELFQKVIKEHE